MKPDLKDRADIDSLMKAFYGKVMVDPLIGYIFTVANLDLDHHLPIIGDFWDTLLFRSGDYSRHGRNPLAVHKELDEKTPLEPQHFERWLEIFSETVDDMYEGPTADFIKLRASAIATRMLETLGLGSTVSITRSAAV